MMYKKIVALSLLCCNAYSSVSDVTPWIEIKPSYFFFYNCPMNEIYNKGGFQVQASGSIPVYDFLQSNGTLDIYCSVGYRQVWGHALNTCEKTTLAVVPIDLGIKPIWTFHDYCFWFVTIGPRFFYLHQHNDSIFVDCNINNWGVGVFVNTGFNVLIKDHFLLGIFGEYSYEPTTICPCKPNVYSYNNLQIGGIAVGLNLGYAF